MQVVHKPDTQEAENEMPKIPHVFRRGGVFYVRKRVPTELVPVLNALEMRVSLKTSDWRRAQERAPYELAHLAAIFDNARKRKASKSLRPAPVKELPDSEIHQLVASWFIREEKKNETWWENEAKGCSPDDLEVVWDNLMADTAHYQTDREVPGKRGSSGIFDPSGMVKHCLEEAGIELAPESPSFVKLASLLRRALVESQHRQMDRVGTVMPCGGIRGGAAHDPLFENWNSQTPEPKKMLTLAKLLSDFERHHEKNSSAGTARTYAIPIRLLRQFFGDECPLSAIGPQEIGKFFDLLEQVPLNAQQRYPGLSLREAIAKAGEKKDSNRLGKKTLANYHRNVTAIFNFGKECRMLADNPANSRIHRDRFKYKREKKTLFELDHLNKLFSAPLYTGCENDVNGYAKPGPNVIRRGRFWVPLLGLFQGLRCNEACQLYTEDVRQEDGIWFLWIREEIDSKAKSDKSLKTEPSERRVPLHEKVVKMGFLDFVRERKKDRNEPHLFPDLPMDKKGYRSNHFSKWFGRFKHKSAPTSKATFHSFRHHWRTQLRRANVSTEDAEELGGWTEGKKSSERIYSHGQTLAALKAAVDLVGYEGLDLSHLIVQSPGNANQVVFPRRTHPDLRSQ